MAVYIDEIVDISVNRLDRIFQYRVPEELLDAVTVGCQVNVPFGSGNRRRQAYVIGVDTVLAYDASKIKDILGVTKAPAATGQLIALADWMHERYGCTMAQALKTVLPVKKSVKEVKRTAYFLADREGAQQLLEKSRKSRREKARVRLLEAMLKEGCMSKETVTGVLQISASTMKSILQTGVIREETSQVYRNPVRQRLDGWQEVCLNDEQMNAVASIWQNAAICREHWSREQGMHLLYGITGSGKTEVYLRAAGPAMEAGKQVLLLVPEIALTAQIVKRFQAWFGDEVAVAHSKLSQNERADVWYKMRTNSAKLLIGVRSAVFAPFSDLGLIIIDEEHESSYKQDERPNYHARTVALKRAQLSGIPVVLGSATPDLESFYKARQGTYTHLRLLQRANGSMLPHVEIADMRLELQRGNKSVLSAALNDALLQTAVQGEQAIVLLNRRGFSTFVMCRDCGESIVCPHCAVALVYHSAGEAMRCHYCGNTAPIPDECPNCHSRRIRFFGTGTQKAEAEIAELPEIRILRMDQDSTVKKFAHEDILKSFSSGEYNVLLGTQMVAKGHDIPNVTLVGILSADSTLNLPDFRASERTFALLTQAAGRAGRGDRAGHVVLQTYDPDNPVIKLAATQDYDAFAASELEIRQELGYPPYTEILKITVLDKEEVRGSSLAQRIVNFLQTLQLEHPEQELLVLGPFPAIVAKVRDLYRMNILVKCPQMELVKRALWNSEFKECRNVFFDVDPVSVV